MNTTDFIAAIARGGTRRELNLFLAHGGDVNEVLAGPHATFLHLAIEADNIEMIEALVAAGAAIETPDRDGATPLLHAVEFDIDSAGQAAGPGEGEFFRNLGFAVTRCLIDLGADPTASLPDGRTARARAASYGPAVVARYDALFTDALG